MVLGIVVLTCEPCLAFLRTSFGSYRAGIPGWMALVGSECAGRRRGVGAENSVFGPGLPIGEAVRSERWAEAADERALLFLGLAFQSVAGPFLCPVVFRLLGRALAQKPVPEGPRVYESDRSPRAPGRFG